MCVAANNLRLVQSCKLSKFKCASLQCKSLNFARWGLLSKKNGLAKADHRRRAEAALDIQWRYPWIAPKEIFSSAHYGASLGSIRFKIKMRFLFLKCANAISVIKRPRCSKRTSQLAKVVRGCKNCLRIGLLPCLRAMDALWMPIIWSPVALQFRPHAKPWSIKTWIICFILMSKMMYSEIG